MWVQLNIAIYPVYITNIGISGVICISFQIGDFGMARDIAGSGGGSDYYKSHGGIIPVKWTAPEVISNLRRAQYYAVYLCFSIMNRV